MPRTMLVAALAVTAASCLPEENVDLGTDESAATVSQWNDDVRIPQQYSQFQVGLAPLGDRLHMLAANGSSGEIFWSQFNGNGWTSRVSIDQFADYGPALTTHDGQLVTVYHQRAQNKLMMSTSSGQTWSAPITAGTPLGAERVHYAPAVVSHLGELYMAYCRHSAAGDAVRVERHEGGTSWTQVASFEIAVGDECKHVSMATIPGDRLHIVWTEYIGVSFPADDYWLVMEASGVGAPSPSWIPRLRPMQSAKPPSMITCNGTAHLLHGGRWNAHEIWWSFRSAGAWTENVRVPKQASDGGAALGCYQGTRTLMVHNGGTTQLWWSEFID